MNEFSAWVERLVDIDLDEIVNDALEKYDDPKTAYKAAALAYKNLLSHIQDKLGALDEHIDLKSAELIALRASVKSEVPEQSRRIFAKAKQIFRDVLSDIR